MAKPDVVAYIADNYKATLVNTEVSKLPAYKGSKGDSHRKRDPFVQT
jgi:hypothetical protein